MFYKYAKTKIQIKNENHCQPFRFNFLHFITKCKCPTHNHRRFPPLAGQQVRLVGFEGFGIYTIDSTIVSEKGHFALSYTSKDKGMGYLAATDNKAYFCGI